MDPVNQREQHIFHECLRIPPRRRSAYLKSVCGSDSSLWIRVERLLAAHGRAEDEGDDKIDRLAGGLLAELDVQTDELSLSSADAVLDEDAGQQAGNIIAGWRLVRKIGEGGMASVWLAERTGARPGPPIAIKLPHAGWPWRVAAERVARERELLATLNHPNIARLLDAGLTASRQPYLALEYVDGVPVSEYCRVRRLSVAARIELFLQITSAISYAHNNLIVHRDLKPSNILVDEAGAVRVLDFGIAKLLQDGVTQQTELTQCSGPALTLDYSSPEQVLGKPLTVASDLYSLAVILYELLTGAAPYRNRRSSRAALEEAILTEEPRPPSELVSDAFERRQIRGDLDTIVLKALKKDVSARYSAVEAFADDLRRYLQKRPVLARPDSHSYRFAKFVRRHRIGVAAAGAIVLVVLAASVTVAWQVRRTLAEKERAETTKAFLISILLDAHSFFGSGQPRSAIDLLQNAQARLSAHTLPDTASRVEVLDIVGAGLLSQQAMRDAEMVIDRAIEDSAVLPEGNAFSLRARLLKQWISLYRGKIVQVRSEIGGLIHDMTKSAATLPEDLAGAHRIRSVSALEAHDFNVAEAAATEALHIAETRLNQRHNQAVLALIDLSYAQLARGNPAARETGERALHRALEAYGSYTHANVIKARVARAQTLAMTGRFEFSIDEMKRAIVDDAALFHPSDRVVGVDLLKLAQLQLRAGQFQPALESADRAKAILLEHLDSSSVGFASLLEVRGSALLGVGRAQEALIELSSAERLYGNAFGPTHPTTISLRELRMSSESRIKY